ncbi:hypothetical protein FKB34_08940 [Glycocaulis profundi]|nr:hypothetical protein FKB34_08940 [Glycocaulis profundi]
MGVRINVGHLEGKQPEISDALTQIVLCERDAIFVPVATFLVSLLSFGALAETYNDSDPKPWGIDDLICLDAASAGFRLTVRGHPIASAVVHNHWPSQIAIDVTIQPEPYDGTNHLGEMGPYLFSAMQGMFTAFYEEHVTAVKNGHGGVSHWPTVWNFGRVVRNALSHGGNLEIRQTTAVSWRSLNYTESDHRKPVILADLWPGDLILLLKDMQDAIPPPP